MPGYAVTKIVGEYKIVLAHIVSYSMKLHKRICNQFSFLFLVKANDT